MKITFLWPRPDHTIHFFVGMSIMAITNSWLLVVLAALGREAYNIFIQKKKDYLDSSLDIFYTIDGAIGGFMLEAFVQEFFNGQILF